MRITDRLASWNACRESREWAAEERLSTWADAWRICPRADWLLWLVALLADRGAVELQRQGVLAACACVRLAIMRVRPERVVLQRVQAAETWARGGELAKADLLDVGLAGDAANWAWSACWTEDACYLVDAAWDAAGAIVLEEDSTMTWTRINTGFLDAGHGRELARFADIVREQIPWASVEAALALYETRTPERAA